jgi:4-hydroxy-4-methyl-2-oxoglutarate aldolase
MPNSVSVPSVVSDMAKALVSFGVATVHESLGRRGLASGIGLMVGPAFAGPAITVALPAGDNLGIHALLRDAAAGAVACVASEGKGIYGVVGDLLALAAAERGIAGLVIDDGIRDLATMQAPPSIAARGVASLGSQKRRFLSLNRPVALGGVLILPGDWVVADADGVCIVPASRIDALLADAAARTEKEVRIRSELGRGRTTAHLFGLTKLIDEGMTRP